MWLPLQSTGGGVNSYPPVQLQWNKSKSTVEESLMKEIDQLKGIIGELTIANETLKKIQATRRGGRP